MSDLPPVGAVIESLRQHASEAREFAAINHKASELATQLAQLLTASATIMTKQETRFEEHLEAWKTNSRASWEQLREIRKATGLAEFDDHDRLMRRLHELAKFETTLHGSE